MSADVETIVAGAGVVGLAIARSLAEAGQEVMVLEQHGLIGSETSLRTLFRKVSSASSVGTWRMVC